MGLAARWRSGCYAGRYFRGRGQVVLCEEKAQAWKSSESVPVYCRGTRTRQSWESSPPAGLATDGESRSGPPRQSRCLLSNLAAQSAWTAGRSTMHRAVWTRSEGRVTATSVRLAVPVSKRRSTTAPRKIQGGCGKKRAFHAVLVVDCFLTLESKFCHGHTICHTLRGP